MWGRVHRARLRAAGGRPSGPEPGWAWPVRLHGVAPTGTAVTLRAIRLGDGPVFQAVRRANAAWLEPWDATSPDPDAPARTFAELVAQYDADARSGRALPFAIEVEGRFVGQMTIGSIVLGSFRSCFAGYWVSRAVAGRMVTPTALALAADHAVGTLGLHRVEVNIRPENTASLAVVRKLGFRSEGLRPHYLHIAGAWRDHLSFALTTEDLAGESFIARLHRLTSPSPGRAETHEPLQPHPRHTEGGPASGAGAHLPS
jgi:ribosomal-protein-alanine N-acetyltransferase